MYKVKFQSKDRKKKKYHNKSKVYTTSLHGTRTFHSIKEANYCEELDWRLKAGEITHYDLQWKIDIRINGVHWANYYIDYRVIHADGTIEYVEIKGLELEPWRLKWKALEILKEELLEPGAELTIIK